MAPSSLRNPVVEIAELPIAIRSDQAITSADNFAPFLTDSYAETECTAQIITVDSLDGDTSVQAARDFDNDVFKQKDGSYIRKYLHPAKTGYYAESVSLRHGTASEVRLLESESQSAYHLNRLFHMSGWEEMLLWHGRLLLHAACVDTTYGGLLFSGPSGIGKSTQEQLWKDYRGARGINGDRPVLYRKDAWRAYGSPMAGSSGEYFNESVPIRAIVMLQQGNENTVRRMPLQEAYRAIYSGTTVYTWDREYVDRVLNLVADLISEVPVYSLTCTPDERAVLTLETVLKEEGC